MTVFTAIGNFFCFSNFPPEKKTTIRHQRSQYLSSNPSKIWALTNICIYASSDLYFYDTNFYFFLPGEASQAKLMLKQLFQWHYDIFMYSCFIVPFANFIVYFVDVFCLMHLASHFPPCCLKVLKVSVLICLFHKCLAFSPFNPQSRKTHQFSSFFPLNIPFLSQSGVCIFEAGVKAFIIGHMVKVYCRSVQNPKSTDFLLLWEYCEVFTDWGWNSSERNWQWKATILTL